MEQTRLIRARISKRELAEAGRRAKAEGIPRTLWIGEHLRRVLDRPAEKTRVVVK